MQVSCIDLDKINNSDKQDLQVMQNDALCLCKGLKLLDMVSIPVIHKS